MISIECTCCIVSDGGPSSPIEISTLVGEDHVRLRAMVSNKNSLQCVVLKGLNGNKIFDVVYGC